MPEARPKIGVISDCALQRHVLSKALNAFGLNPVISCEPDMLAQQQSEKLDQIQCWILALQEDTFESVALDDIIDQADNIPVLFGLDKAPGKHDEQYISWERRLVSKLEEHLGCIDILESEDSILALDSQATNHVAIDKAQSKPVFSQPSDIEKAPRLSHPPSKDVWVLAASLGGPAAVKEFLDEIPSTIRAGFLYAQHVDAHFSGVLTRVLGRHSMLDLKPITDCCLVKDGEVLVVPVDNEVCFSSNGVSIRDNEWEGPYGPSIDHLLRNLFAHYGKRCHVIVFSGMGNDGSLMAPTMHKQGCSVWTQAPDGCANGSMPQSVIDLECSAYTASPKDLARALINKVGCYSAPDASASNLETNKGV
ncbi:MULTISPECIES: chemotaxis protein CheB [unclassified Oleiphilus]|nr:MULTISPECIES: chemotaxis protein CheB [unclassified Oleiphilus]